MNISKYWMDKGIIRYNRQTYLEQVVRMEFRKKKLSVKASQISQFSTIWEGEASKLLFVAIIRVFGGYAIVLF